MAKKKVLDISDELVLDLDQFLNSTQMIVAKKRRGKSYLAQKQAEELLRLEQQIVVLDPTGAWWGLRSSADGKSDGYPIHIFGGDHGDVPLDPASGEVLARAIVEEGFSAVLDLTSMRKGERLRFSADFLETLYRLNRSAMHLYIDEADVFAPQVTRDPQQARLLGATDELVRRGGIRGIGVTLITQRTQVVSKDVISQIDTMMVLQMSHPKDIKAIRDWVVDHVDEEKAEEMLASLPSLPRGTPERRGVAWYWDPEHDLFQRITVSRKRTYDSGRSPKAGERIKPPKVLARVDLERLGASMASAVADAKANDPRVLRARIAELERSSAAPKIATASDRREQVLDAENTRLRRELAEARDWEHGVDAAIASIAKLKRGTRGAKLAEPAPVAPAAAARWKPTTAVPSRREPPAARDASSSSIEPRQMRVLKSIAWWNAMGIAEPNIVAVAAMAGYSSTNSSYEKIKSALRVAGLVEYPRPGEMRLTAAGVSAAGETDRPTTRAELHAAIERNLEPRHWRVLHPLIDAFPRELAIDELAERSNYSPTNSSFEKIKSTLRGYGFAEYPRPGFVVATEVLFP